MNEKIPSVIRWKRSDYMKLSYAVRRFNQVVKEFESEEKEYAPAEFNYSEVRNSIYSRKELNRVIKALNRFGKDSQQRIVEIPSGEKLTQWEYSELKKAQKRAINQTTYKAFLIVDDNRNVMGDKEFKQLIRTRESIEDVFNRTGSEFRRTAKRTLTWGKTDYDLWRASVYRESYMEALKEMSNYDNYKLLRDKLNSIENPIQFYNYVRQSNTLSDLFLFYKDKATAQTYGGFKSNQEAFNHGLEELGIIVSS